MPEPELALLFVRRLNRAGIRYVVGGSIAAIIYGEPRLTHDVDFVVFLTEQNIRQLREIFEASEFYCLLSRPSSSKRRGSSAGISISFIWTRASKPISTCRAAMS